MENQGDELFWLGTGTVPHYCCVIMLDKTGSIRLTKIIIRVTTWAIIYIIHIQIIMMIMIKYFFQQCD